MMFKSERKAIFLLTIIFLITIFNTFIYQIFKINSFSYVIFLSIIFITFYFFLGYKKDDTLNKIDIILLIIIYSIGYLVLTYLLGIIFGFYKNPYKLDTISIIKNAAFVFLSVFLREKIRYILVFKNKKLLIFVLTIIVFSLLEILLQYKSYNYNTPLDIFEVIGYLILPVIINNSLLTFLTYKFGIIPSIIYSQIFSLYIFLIPIFPDFGLYITSVLNIIFPTIIFLRFHRIYIVEKFTKTKREKFLNVVLIIPLITILLVMSFLISGLFKYYLMAIGSNSMYPSIKKGDAIVVEKLSLKEINNIKVNDILVYEHNNIIMVHRVFSISKENNQLIFKTKGDNNTDVDKWNVLEKDIIGIKKIKISYIGYPSVWLSESIKE